MKEFWIAFETIHVCVYARGHLLENSRKEALHHEGIPISFSHKAFCGVDYLNKKSRPPWSLTCMKVSALDTASLANGQKPYHLDDTRPCLQLPGYPSPLQMDTGRT